MKKYLYIFFAIAVMAFSSCSSEKIDEPDQSQEIINNDDNDDIDDNGYGEERTEFRGPLKLTSRQQLASYAMDDFGMDYFRFNATDDNNYVVSPVSLSQCMALMANGVSGVTLDQMITTLDNGNGLGLDDFNDYWRIQATDLPAVSPGSRIEMVNSIWSNPTFMVKDSYIANINKLLDAEHHVVDSGNVKDQINSYVDKKTRGMIKTCLIANLILIS